MGEAWKVSDWYYSHQGSGWRETLEGGWDSRCLRCRRRCAPSACSSCPMAWRSLSRFLKLILSAASGHRFPFVMLNSVSSFTFHPCWEFWKLSLTPASNGPPSTISPHVSDHHQHSCNKNLLRAYTFQAFCWVRWEGGGLLEREKEREQKRERVCRVLVKSVDSEARGHMLALPPISSVTLGKAFLSP